MTWAYARENAELVERMEAAMTQVANAYGGTYAPPVRLDDFDNMYWSKNRNVVLCLAAAASLIPVTSGGVIANVGATAAVLLVLGVHRQEAINFGLASGLLLCTTAAAAAVVGLATSFALSRGHRRSRTSESAFSSSVARSSPNPPIVRA